MGDNMSFFDATLINIIFIFLLISIYLIFVLYNKEIKDKNKGKLLDIICISMMYPMIKYSFLSKNIGIIFFLNLPLIILYLKKRKLSSFIVSLIIISYYTIYYNFSLYFLLIEYLVYYFLFDIYKDNIDKTLNIFIFLKGITLSIELIYLISYEGPLYKLILQIFLNLCIFYLSSIISLKMLEKGEQIVSYNKLLNELEKEKTLKNSLFKITHEVKNPIAVCKGYLSMMNYNDINKVKKYNDIIKSELDRTLDIMDNFSQYTKININKDIMDLNMLIEESINTIKLLLNNKNINLIYNNKQDIYINGDYSRLKQVIVNMIKNSAESIDKDGKIGIYLKDHNNNIDIFIKDNGHGMNKEELKKIYDLFYTSKEKGCGIGVCLSKEIIKLHNGKMKYYSTKDIGTTVKITLPKI